MDALVAPLYFYPWHITALLNSLLVWALFIWADQKLRRFDQNDPEKLNTFMDRTLVVRRILTVTTSFNMLMVVAHLAQLFQHLEFRWTLPG